MEAGEDRRLLVLYATQTGTAKEVAEHVAREAKRRHFQPRTVGMDTYATVYSYTREQSRIPPNS